MRRSRANSAARKSDDDAGDAHMWKDQQPQPPSQQQQSNAAAARPAPPALLGSSASSSSASSRSSAASGGVAVAASPSSPSQSLLSRIGMAFRGGGSGGDAHSQSNSDAGITEGAAAAAVGAARSPDSRSRSFERHGTAQQQQAQTNAGLMTGGHSRSSAESPSASARSLAARATPRDRDPQPLARQPSHSSLSANATAPASESRSRSAASPVHAGAQSGAFAFPLTVVAPPRSSDGSQTRLRSVSFDAADPAAAAAMDAIPRIRAASHTDEPPAVALSATPSPLGPRPTMQRAQSVRTPDDAASSAGPLASPRARPVLTRKSSVGAPVPSFSPQLRAHGFGSAASVTPEPLSPRTPHTPRSRWMGVRSVVPLTSPRRSFGSGTTTPRSPAGGGDGSNASSMLRLPGESPHSADAHSPFPATADSASESHSAQKRSDASTAVSQQQSPQLRSLGGSFNIEPHSSDSARSASTAPPKPASYVSLTLPPMGRRKRRTPSTSELNLAADAAVAGTADATAVPASASAASSSSSDLSASAPHSASSLTSPLPELALPPAPLSARYLSDPYSVIVEEPHSYLASSAGDSSDPATAGGTGSTGTGPGTGTTPNRTVVTQPHATGPQRGIFYSDHSKQTIPQPPTSVDGEPLSASSDAAAATSRPLGSISVASHSLNSPLSPKTHLSSMTSASERGHFGSTTAGVSPPYARDLESQSSMPAHASAGDDKAARDRLARGSRLGQLSSLGGGEFSQLLWGSGGLSTVVGGADRAAREDSALSPKAREDDEVDAQRAPETDGAQSPPMPIRKIKVEDDGRGAAARAANARRASDDYSTYKQQQQAMERQRAMAKQRAAQSNHAARLLSDQSAADAMHAAASYNPDQPYLFIHPSSRFFLVWTVVLIVVTWYTCFETVWVVAFDVQVSLMSPQRYPALVIFNVLADLVMLADVVVYASKGFFDDTLEMQSSGRIIRRQYARTWLLIDLVACMPLETIQMVAFASAGASASNRNSRFPGLDGGVHNTWITSMAFQLLKLGRMGKIVKVMPLSQTKTSLAINETVRGFFAFVYLLLLSHTVACGWWLVARVEESLDSSTHTWVDQSQLHGEPLMLQYLVSLNWSLATLISIGFGGSSDAATTAERIYTLAVVVFAALAYVQVVGNFMLVIENISHATRRHQQCMAEMQDYMQRHAFPPELTARVLRFQATQKTYLDTHIGKHGYLRVEEEEHFRQMQLLQQQRQEQHYESLRHSEVERRRIDSEQQLLAHQMHPHTIPMPPPFDPIATQPQASGSSHPVPGSSAWLYARVCELEDSSGAAPSSASLFHASASSLSTYQRSEDKLLSTLPACYHLEIAMLTRGSLVASIFLFRDLPSAVLSALTQALRSSLYVHGDFICKENRLGRTLFLLRRGEVELIEFGALAKRVAMARAALRKEQADAEEQARSRAAHSEAEAKAKAKADAAAAQPKRVGHGRKSSIGSTPSHSSARVSSVTDPSAAGLTPAAVARPGSPPLVASTSSSSASLSSSLSLLSGPLAALPLSKPVIRTHSAGWQFGESSLVHGCYAQTVRVRSEVAEVCWLDLPSYLRLSETFPEFARCIEAEVQRKDEADRGKARHEANMCAAALEAAKSKHHGRSKRNRAGQKTNAEGHKAAR